MPKPKQLKESDLEHVGSLIRIKGTNNCLGDLLVVPEVIDKTIGERPAAGTVFDPTYGRIPISARDADKHNKALSKALIDDLDNQCEIGQGSYFYWYGSTCEIETWSGDLVAFGTQKGKVITFERNGKLFVGRKQKDSDSVFFERVK